MLTVEHVDGNEEVRGHIAKATLHIFGTLPLATLETRPILHTDSVNESTRGHGEIQHATKLVAGLLLPCNNN